MAKRTNDRSTTSGARDSRPKAPRSSRAKKSTVAPEAVEAQSEEQSVLVEESALVAQPEEIENTDSVERKNVVSFPASNTSTSDNNNVDTKGKLFIMTPEHKKALQENLARYRAMSPAEKGAELRRKAAELIAKAEDIESGKVAAAKTPVAKLTEEEKVARREARKAERASLTPEQRVAEAEARAAKMVENARKQAAKATAAAPVQETVNA